MVDHRATVEPVPRRIRGYLDNVCVFDFPTRALTSITNLVAFYSEDVDLCVDGRLMERPGRAGHRVS